MTHKVQAPEDTQDWQQDWLQYLAAGDSVVTREWSISPDSSPSHLANTTDEAVRVSGLVLGQVYELSEKITSVNGIVAERSITIRCENI